MSGVPIKAVVACVVEVPSESYSDMSSPEWMSIALIVAPLGFDKMSQVRGDKEPLPEKSLQELEEITEVLNVWKY
jgi:hypothetical protein